MKNLRRGYVDCRFGQLHYHAALPAVLTRAAPLACLHATAYSGRTFMPLMRALSPRRAVHAPDTPGYGGSDAPPGRAGIEALAGALFDGLSALVPEGPIDLFGYHTGAMLAVEIAARHPGRIGRMTLVGIPFFEAAELDEWRARLVHPAPAAEALADFGARWDFLVTRRHAGIPHATAVANFADELRAWPRESWAHVSLFEYAAAEQLAQVRCPVQVINPPVPLAPHSRAAARRLADARILECPDLPVAVLDAGADALARLIEAFHDEPQAAPCAIVSRA